jgi:hypothetical protein
VLLGGVVGVVVVLGVVAGVLLRRRSHDDVHSVEHYHRQLHTLEEIRSHPTGAGRSAAEGAENGNGEPYPASAIRVSGSSTVRLTEPGRPEVPPVPPPPAAGLSEPVTFDDAAPEPVSGSFMTGSEDRVMQSINHRPRRLGGPLAAVASVAVLVAILIVTGLHSNTSHHAKASGTATTARTRPTTTPHPARSHTTPTTTTTAPPAVSAPAGASAHGATWRVADPSYSLVLAATSGDCWVDATNTATGSVLFTGTLLPGQSHTIAATGPVTVVAGAPVAFSATIDGTAVTLPVGSQAPFTLSFQT